MVGRKRQRSAVASTLTGAALVFSASRLASVDATTYCATDGSDYDYYESVNANKGFRKIITNHCPNHLFTNEIGDNPNQAVMEQKT